MTANTSIPFVVAGTSDFAEASVATLFEQSYDWLTRVASHILNPQLRLLGLDEPSLVHEAFLRLSRFERSFSSVAGFRVAARRTLERAAVDCLRRSRRIKRGGRRSAVPIDVANVITDGRDTLAEVELSDLLTRLHLTNPRLARIAKRMLRGDRVPAIARDLGLSSSTVRMCCTQIRGWLRSRYTE